MRSIFCAALLASATLMSAPTVALAQNEAGATDAAATAIAASRRIYDEAGAPGMENDSAARLAIYRRALAALDRNPAPLRADPRAVNYRLFLRATVAVHMLDGPEQAAGFAEIERLLPVTRAALAAAPREEDLLIATTQMLRVNVRTGIMARNWTAAAVPARELLTLTRQAVAADANDSFVLRGLAIDLDQLAAIESELGNRAAADQYSAEALDLFRELAAAEPASRPAQGSLLIALLRRAITFSEITRLDQAEAQVAAMRARGQLEGNYVNMANAIPDIRREIQQRR